MSGILGPSGYSAQAHGIAGAVGAIGSLWISLSISVQVLLVLMVIDMCTGVMRAGREGKLSISIGRNGVTKKAGVIIVLLVAYILQYLAEQQIGAGFAFPVKIGSAVALAYVVIESISVLQNCRALGAPIPSILDQLLKKASQAVESDGESKGNL